MLRRLLVARCVGFWWFEVDRGREGLEFNEGSRFGVMVGLRFPLSPLWFVRVFRVWGLG